MKYERSQPARCRLSFNIWDEDQGGLMDAVKVVVRYADGKVIKGYTQDFFPNKDRFHLQPQQKSSGQDTQQVLVKDLKAIFFVRDFGGNPAYDERGASSATGISRRAGRWRSSSRTARNSSVRLLATSPTARASSSTPSMTRATISESSSSRPPWIRCAISSRPLRRMPASEGERRISAACQ